ncbi:MAG TPA: EAL domain-containing protein [Casimicrobiaceae bacterium]|nr:EAL domain-containing protein [Casimicrobiaceae bacterium]
MLRTLRAGHRALLRAGDEATLVETICKALVDEGGYPIAWIGYADNDAERTIRIVGHAGASEAMLARLQLSWDASRPSVSGEAIRTGTPSVGRRLRSDPVLARWRSDAARLGYGAVSAFPLRIGDEVIGCLTLVAADENAFDESEVALLQELADDAAYGIGHSRMQTRGIEAEQTIARMALRDPLTGLPNRAAMRATLRDAIAISRETGVPLAVLSIHAAHFDEIGDTLGRDASDTLVLEMARRVRDVAADAEHRLARIGDDDLLLLANAESDDAGALARRIDAALYPPMDFAGVQLDARGAIGVALYPAHGDDPDELMRRAKTAMYQAGTGGFAFYSGLHDDARRQSLALIGDLRRAIENGDLLLYCQPKARMATCRLCGAEALMRWRHPREGMVSPSRFVALAEHAGLITPLTQWVLEAAFRERRRWHESGFDQPLAVNVSPRDFHDPMLVARVRDLMAAHETMPGWIEFELTESALMEEPERVIETLRQLRDLGIESMVDDYGSGYSSLRYLQQMPVSAIKIDQSFVRGMRSDADSAAIVHSTIELCHTLSFAAIAEGVEDEASWNALSDEGCDAVQGYYVGRPLPVDEFKAWAATSRWNADSRAQRHAGSFTRTA